MRLLHTWSAALRCCARTLPLRAWLLLGGLTLSVASPGWGANGLEATSSRAARQEAIQSIPFDALSPEQAHAVAAVLDDTTIFRRLPTEVIQCDPRLFYYLVQHPDVLVNIWEVMGISNVSLTRSGEGTFRASDGKGTLGSIHVLHNRHDKQVLLVEGEYDGPMFPRPVKAKCVVLLRSGYLRETDGRYYVTGRMDAFIQLDRVGIELLAKTFQPLVGKTADHNFTETMGFVSRLSRAAERNPDGVDRLAPKLTRVAPESRQMLVKIAHEMAERSDEQQAAYRTEPSVPSDEETLMR